MPRTPTDKQKHNRRGPRPEWSFFMLPEDHKGVKRLMSFLQAKFTVWGQIIFGMVLVGMAISAVGTQISAYYFVSLVWALFITAWFLSLFFTPAIIVERYLPPTPTAGGICFYRVSVTNIGKAPLRNLEVFDHKLPYGLYSVMTHPQQKNFIEWLDPGEKVDLTVALRIPRRGTYTIFPLIAGTSFPTGLIRSIRRVTHSEPFIVHPLLIKLGGNTLTLRHKFQYGGTHSSAKFGNTNEFLSTREYREGDRPRDIHWNSSARTGKLIVKEYIDEYTVRVGFFIDTELKRFEKHRCFEERISLCAGMAEDLYEKNYTVELFSSDKVSSVVEVGQGRGSFSFLLDMLSAIEGRERVDFAPFLAAIKERPLSLSGMILFLKDWDNERAQLVRTIKEMNIETRVIIIRNKPLTLAVNDPTVSVYTSRELESKKI